MADSIPTPSKDKNTGEGDTPTITKPKDDRKRRGRGSKDKQAERFRSKKNQGFDEELQLKLQKFKISLGYTPEQLFGKRNLTAVVRPQLEFPIYTDTIGELCDDVAMVLHEACKVPPSSEVPEDKVIDYDAETLKWVSALQIESKLYYARSGTNFIPELEPEVANRALRTNTLLSDALVPLAVYLDQIGRFDVQDQLFVPAFCGCDFSYGRLADRRNNSRLHFSTLQDPPQVGVRTNFRDQYGKVMYAHIPDVANAQHAIQEGIAIEVDGEIRLSEEFLMAPHQFQYFGIVEFVPGPDPPAPPSFEQIVARFAGLRGRVLKKVNNAFLGVNLSVGTGSEAQLVFRRRIARSSVFQVWSPRAVRSDALEMGAVLELGAECPLGREDIATVSTTIDTSGALRNLANVLTVKMAK